MRVISSLMPVRVATAVPLLVEQRHESGAHVAAAEKSYHEGGFTPPSYRPAPVGPVSPGRLPMYCPGPAVNGGALAPAGLDLERGGALTERGHGRHGLQIYFNQVL